MNAETASGMLDSPPNRRSRNWWKVAFFVALVAFEMAREIAVIEGAEGAEPGSSFHIYNGGGFVAAQGTWARTDGGSPLVPAAIKIECREERGECVEASSNTIDGYVFPANLDWFEAKFTPDAVTYENDVPECARYSVRIDFSLNKVLAVRDRKEGVTSPLCVNLEKRIEMELSDAYKLTRDPLEGHFVPVLSGIVYVGNALR